MTWERTYARWAQVPEVVIQSEPDALERTARSLVDRLRATLHDEAGWSYEELANPGAPTITLQTTTSHSDAFVRNTVAVLAETRALQLLNPNPLPDLRLIRWRRR